MSIIIGVIIMISIIMTTIIIFIITLLVLLFIYLFAPASPQGPCPWKVLATTYEQMGSWAKPSSWRKSWERESCYGDRV